MLCLPWKKTDLCTPPDTRIQEGLTPGIRRCVSPFSCSFTVSFSFTIRYILRCFSLCFSIFPGCFPSFSLLSERKPQDKVTPPQRIFSVLLFSGFPETVHKQIQRASFIGFQRNSAVNTFLQQRTYPAISSWLHSILPCELLIRFLRVPSER